LIERISPILLKTNQLRIFFGNRISSKKIVRVLRLHTAREEAADPVTYAIYLAGFNFAQNSWNYGFFNNLGTSLETFDPAAEGSYKIYLKVRDPSSSKGRKGSKGKGKVVAKVEIEVIVSEPPPPP
jgi:hypothetical protein